MNRHREQRAEEFAIKQLAIGTNREQIIALLCENHSMNWEEAEAFLLDLEIRQGAQFVSRSFLIIIVGLGAVLLGSLFVGVYIIATIVCGSTVKVLWITLAFITGIGLLSIALAIYSRNENSTRERHRCPHCGFLVNRAGHENTIFLPRYEVSTYHTNKKVLSTRSDGESPTGEAWDIYAEYEITKICRRCHQVRNKKIVEKKRSYSLTPKNDNFDNYPW